MRHCNAYGDGASNTKSSAYINWLKDTLLRLQSIFIALRAQLSLSMYTLNKKDDSTPPCLTPLLTLKEYDSTLPHLIINTFLFE